MMFSEALVFYCFSINAANRAPVTSDGNRSRDTCGGYKRRKKKKEKAMRRLKEPDERA